MNPQQINFTHQLIKGRIAETIFEQMLRDTNKFTILSFGYEKILPELAHRQGDVHAEETMEIIRRAPDFAVINNETHEVHLIEVKYRKDNVDTWNLDIAKQMSESWKPSYLFLATPTGFYFDKALDIVEHSGRIHELHHKDIPQELQKKYLVQLNEFIKRDKAEIE